MASPALLPTAVLPLPVQASNEDSPMAVLSSAQFALRARYPTAVLLAPSSVASPAAFPIKVFLIPVVTDTPAL